MFSDHKTRVVITRSVITRHVYRGLGDQRDPSHGPSLLRGPEADVKTAPPGAATYRSRAHYAFSVNGLTTTETNRQQTQTTDTDNRQTFWDIKKTKTNRQQTQTTDKH